MWRQFKLRQGHVPRLGNDKEGRWLGCDIVTGFGIAASRAKHNYFLSRVEGVQFPHDLCAQFRNENVVV
jgi:hypothetical protein